MKRCAHWLTQKQMAKAHGITVQGFVQWGVEPVEKIGREVFYLAGDVTENRLAWQEKKLQKQIDSRDDTVIAPAEREAKLKLTEAQAEFQEIKNAKLNNELAPVAIIEWVLGKIGSQIAAILESIPMLLKKRNPKLTATDIHLITREIVKTQNAAAAVQVDFEEYPG